MKREVFSPELDRLETETDLYIARYERRDKILNIVTAGSVITLAASLMFLVYTIVVI